MALDDEGFVAFFNELIAAWPQREYDPAAFALALGYPWERPPGSYVLRGDDVSLLDAVGPGKRASIVDCLTEDRHPILSFGANAAPSRLAMKFAHLPGEVDREALVLIGDLRDFDVGAVASPGLLGYLPATLFASPGTAVRAAVVWVTPAQATQLAWSEMTYRLGLLEDARFDMNEGDVEIDGVFAFVSRLGAFCVDGAPVAMAAIPAKGRTAAALTQEELLDAMARLVIGPEARAEDLVRATYADLPGVFARAAETVWPSARQLQSRWTPFPASERVALD